jgi:hypothetical protein
MGCYEQASPDGVEMEEPAVSASSAVIVRDSSRTIAIAATMDSDGTLQADSSNRAAVESESIAAVASGTLQGLCTAQEAPASPSGQIEQAPKATFPNKAVGEGQANANAVSAAELSPAEGLTACSHSQSSDEYHGEGRAAEQLAEEEQDAGCVAGGEAQESHVISTSGASLLPTSAISDDESMQELWRWQHSQPGLAVESSAAASTSLGSSPEARGSGTPSGKARSLPGAFDRERSASSGAGGFPSPDLQMRHWRDLGGAVGKKYYEAFKTRNSLTYTQVKAPPLAIGTMHGLLHKLHLDVQL